METPLSSLCQASPLPGTASRKESSPAAAAWSAARQAAQQHDLAGAIAGYVRFLKIIQNRWESPAQAAAVYGEIGRAYHNFGRPRQARRFLERAIIMGKKTADFPLWDLGLLHSRLGYVCQDLSRYDQARINYERALVLLREAGEPIRAAEVSVNLASLHARLGNTKEVIKQAREAVTVFAHAGEKRWMALAYVQLAIAWRQFSEFHEAESAGNRALEMALGENDWYQAGLAALSLGDLAWYQGKLALARNWYARSHEFRSRAGDPKAPRAWMSQLGSLAFGEEDYARSALWYLRAWRLGRRTHPDLDFDALFGAGRALLAMKRWNSLTRLTRRLVLRVNNDPRQEALSASLEAVIKEQEGNLAERREDIALLVRKFSRAAAERTGKSPKTFSPDALELIACQKFPGHLRELRNLVEQACLLVEETTVEPRHLQSLLPKGSGIEKAVVRQGLPKEFLSLRELERRHLLAALDRTGGNLLAAARLLRIARSTLYHKLKKLSPTPSLQIKNTAAI